MAASSDAGEPRRLAIMRETLQKSMAGWRKGIKASAFAEAYPSLHKLDPTIVTNMFDELWKQLCDSAAADLEDLMATHDTVQRLAALEKLAEEVDYERETFKRPAPLAAPVTETLLAVETEAMAEYATTLQAALEELRARNDALEEEVARMDARTVGVKASLEKRISVIGAGIATADAILAPAQPSSSSATAAAASSAASFSSSSSSSAAPAAAALAGAPVPNEPPS